MFGIFKEKSNFQSIYEYYSGFVEKHVSPSLFFIKLESKSNILNKS